MKTMTCKQLGGTCEMPFHAASFEDMVQQSKRHGMDMFQQGDAQHLAAMTEIQNLMKTPDAMKTWFDNKRKEFDALPDDK